MYGLVLFESLSDSQKAYLKNKPNAFYLLSGFLIHLLQHLLKIDNFLVRNNNKGKLVMTIKIKEKSDYLKLLAMLLMTLGSCEISANQLDDQDLAQQSVGVVKLSPIIIQAVKQDVQQSVDEQKDLHNKIAQQQADAAKKDEIYSTVLTDFEWQKKDPDPNKPGDKYITPLEKYKIIDIGFNPYQRHDVRITTQDRVTLYIGHEVDPVAYK